MIEYVNVFRKNPSNIVIKVSLIQPIAGRYVANVKGKYGNFIVQGTRKTQVIADVIRKINDIQDRLGESYSYLLEVTY